MAGFPLTIKGRTWAASDFAPYGYAQNFPIFVGEVADEFAGYLAQAQAVAAAAATKAGEASAAATTATAKAAEASASATAVSTALSAYAPLASPALTGTPTAPTAAAVGRWWSVSTARAACPAPGNCGPRR